MVRARAVSFLLRFVGGVGGGRGLSFKGEIEAREINIAASIQQFKEYMKLIV